MTYSKEQMDTWCMKGIAATHAVDEVRKKFKNCPAGFLEEEFLIEVGMEFEKELDQL